MLPFGPAASPARVESSPGTVKRVTAPLVVIRSISPRQVVIQSALSGPATIARGVGGEDGDPPVALATPSGNSETSPDVVIRPTFPELLVNQSAPSGPEAIDRGVTTMAGAPGGDPA